MNPTDCGLVFFGGGLRYFTSYRWDGELLIVTFPNGEEGVVKDYTVKIDGKYRPYRAEKAIYKYPKDNGEKRVSQKAEKSEK